MKKIVFLTYVIDVRSIIVWFVVAHAVFKLDWSDLKDSSCWPYHHLLRLSSLLILASTVVYLLPHGSP